MMLLELFLNFLGIIIFLTPGIFLGFLLFPKLDIVERTVFSLSLSVGLVGVLSILIYYLKLFNQSFFLLTITAVSTTVFLLLLRAYKKNGSQLFKTSYDKSISILYIILFALFGTLWRLLFIKSINNLSDPYTYSFKFVGKLVPNLGYYTGMALDKSKYIGTVITGGIFKYLHIGSAAETFLATFLFLGFLFLVFKEYRQDKRMAYLGVAIMAIGPVELFYATQSIYGHSLAYASILPLFLLFKSERMRLFWIILLFSLIMMITYYTSSVTIALSSFGFLVALVVKHSIKTKNIKKTILGLLRDKKFLYFLIILLTVSSYIFLVSKMANYSIGRMKNFSDLEVSKQKINVYDVSSETPDNINFGTNNQIDILYIDTLYKDPAFLGLSAIRWQILFFTLCGFSFILYLILKRKFREEEIDLLLCLIPVTIISYGFFHVNLPTRIFNYFAFFGLMSFKLPKKHFKIIFFAFLVFILISGFYVLEDKRVFLETPHGEITAAKEIKNHLNDKIFSDETFINQLILSDYYNVTGADDKDQIVKNLFYQKDKDRFLNSISLLNNSGVDYIAITKRMMEKYILMVNYPQKPILNFDLYEINLNKVYDNGNVKIYSTDIKIKTND